MSGHAERLDDLAEARTDMTDDGYAYDEDERAALKAGAAALREVAELRAALAQWKHEHCENAHDKHEDCTAMCSCYGSGLSPLECADERIEALIAETTAMRARMGDARLVAAEFIREDHTDNDRYARACGAAVRILAAHLAPAGCTCADPLPGERPDGRKRCRLCNAEDPAPAQATCPANCVDGEVNQIEPGQPPVTCPLCKGDGRVFDVVHAETCNCICKGAR